MTPNPATPRDSPRPAWRKRPGSIDTLNLTHLWPYTNDFGIPDLLPQPADLTPPADLFPLRYRQKIRTTRPLLLHFHTDDYRFENIWTTPTNGLASAARPQIWAACTPDFSLWLEYPPALQLYNTYRNRWTGRYWQHHGLTVIPSVSWSEPSSYDYSFAGIPPGQIVTLHAFTRINQLERALFLTGYNAMIATLQPRHILWFGSLATVVDDHIPKTVLPIGWIPDEKAAL